MRVTAILTAAERKRQDRSVHRAEERRRRAKMMRVCGPDLPAFERLGPCKRRPGPKTLDQ